MTITVVSPDGEPRAYSEITFENEFFRCTKWTIEPGATIPMHVHEYEYVVVPLSDNTMQVTTGTGELIEAQMQPGTAYGRAKGAEHTNYNAGDSDIVFIEVESLKA